MERWWEHERGGRRGLNVVAIACGVAACTCKCDASADLRCQVICIHTWHARTLCEGHLLLLLLLLLLLCSCT